MSELLCRRNTILEALAAGRRDFHRLLLAEDATPASTNAVRAAARQRGVREETISAEKLAQLAHGEKHQGALLAVGDYPYVELSDVLDSVPAGALPLGSTVPAWFGTNHSGPRSPTIGIQEAISLSVP